MVMKMKSNSKLLLFGVMVASSLPIFGKSAQAIINDARKDYYDSLKPKKADKAITVIENADGSVEEVHYKPKTRLEKLEYNTQRAKDRVDFYQRVVRSVQREENELKGFNDVFGKNKSSKKIIKKSSGK
jgi:hypothetical protein